MNKNPGTEAIAKLKILEAKIEHVLKEGTLYDTQRVLREMLIEFRGIRKNVNNKPKAKHVDRK